jgi:orotate phosphoribosyltransferase
MNKLTNILDESSKSDFQTEVRIELENGLVLEGTFKITDYGLSYAKETSNKLVESNIKNVEILNVEQIVEKIENETEVEADSDDSDIKE